MNPYQHSQRFDREQLQFVVEAILTAALDRMEALQLESSDYEEGAIETAGMVLALLRYKLTGEPTDIQDALALAGGFSTAATNCTSEDDITRHAAQFVVSLPE